MKSIILLLIISVTACSTKAQPIPEAILGEWVTAGNNGKVNIYKLGNKYYGKLSWTTTNYKDANNPNPTLRTQNVLGTILLKNFVYNGTNKWQDGTIYDPNNGKTYSCNLYLKNKNTLEIRGYVGISIFGRTEVWTRL